MFERFTDQARRVVVLAQEEARELNHNYIGTEHLLLGVIHEGQGVASEVLKTLGVSLEAVRERVREIAGPGKKSPSGHIPFTPQAKKVLELSLREALILGSDYIGTEHILLGLLREGDGVACQVLVGMGLDLHLVRETVIRQAREGAPEVRIATANPGRISVSLGSAAFTGIEERLERIERRLGIEPPARSPELRRLEEELAAARAEIERLTALLREHNIDPAA